MHTASAVCDRVAFVTDGRIVASGSPRELGLAHGSRRVRVEYRGATGPATEVLDLAAAADRLADLVGTGTVETIHTLEADLDEVFAAVTASAP